MRFRAKLDKEHFAVFFNQMQQLGQLGKDAILCFDPTMIRSVLKNDDEALQVFATVIAKSVFAEYRIESKNANRIGLEVMLPNLLHALKSGHAATATQIKLTRHGASPFLSIISQSVEGGVSVQQDVPVRVLVAAELERYNEPMMPPPPIRFRFPNARIVHAVVDRMRALSKTLRIDAVKAEATAVLSVKSETVAMRTFFRDLPVEEAVGGPDVPSATVHVPIRNMARALRVLSAAHAMLLMCVTPGTNIVVHVQNEEGSTAMTFILLLVDVGDTGDE